MKKRSPKSNTVPNKQARPFDLIEAFRLKMVNKLSFSQLSDLYDLPKSTIAHRMKSLVAVTDDPGLQDLYDQNKAQLLGNIERVLAFSLLDGKAIEKASLNNRAYAFANVHHARRVEEELPTEIVAYQTKIRRADELLTWLKQHKSDVIDITPGAGIGSGATGQAAQEAHSTAQQQGSSSTSYPALLERVESIRGSG